MSVLKVYDQNKLTEIEFSGRTRLSELLEAHGLMPATPCGGNGKCGKCSAYLGSEKVLTCMAYVEESAELYLPKKTIISKIRTDGYMPQFTPKAQSGYGIAVDIGTTTVVARLVDLSTGELLNAARIPSVISASLPRRLPTRSRIRALRLR